MTSARNIARQYSRRMKPSEEARAAIDRAAGDQSAPIVTTIEPAATWYPAETDHQDYWANEGQRNPYCLAIIPPKLAKLRKSFQARLKSETAA